MTNFKRTIVSAAAAGAMFLNLATPALAGTEIVISGNGSGSDNWADVKQETKTVVSQENNAQVTNVVKSNANTGNNDANFNTGGHVGIQTGDAKTSTSVNNTLNSNMANVDCCDEGDTNVEISGNGAFTDNTVKLDLDREVKVYQDNYANVDNRVESDANTGKNDAKANTGGDVLIRTGDAKTYTTVSTTANVNSANVGNGSHGHDGNPSATFMITGNGAGSDNYITADLDNDVKVDQENVAYVDNIVEADADSGDNDANFNTGGDVFVITGDAKVTADVDNAVNFNHADVDCGCTWDVFAKIAGNGADPDNHERHDEENVISLDLETEQLLFQDNYSNLDNYLYDLDADTGDNEASSNTGEVDSDPAVVTGDAVVETGVSNSGNVNVIGDMDFDFPEMPEVDFSFNMAALWAFFGFSA